MRFLKAYLKCLASNVHAEVSAATEFAQVRAVWLGGLWLVQSPRLGLVIEPHAARLHTDIAFLAGLFVVGVCICRNPRQFALRFGTDIVPEGLQSPGRWLDPLPM